LSKGDGPESTQGDPYDADTADPAQSHALESSLWETRALLKHYLADVARLPLVFATPYLRKSEMDVARASTASYTTLVLVCRFWGGVRFLFAKGG
jgi:hypothetical protein